MTKSNRLDAYLWFNIDSYLFDLPIGFSNLDLQSECHNHGTDRTITIVANHFDRSSFINVDADLRDIKSSDRYKCKVRITYAAAKALSELKTFSPLRCLKFILFFHSIGKIITLSLNDKLFVDAINSNIAGSMKPCDFCNINDIEDKVLLDAQVSENLNFFSFFEYSKANMLDDLTKVELNTRLNCFEID